ncbi:MAG: hypothetical protein KAY37_10005 [Phycisphaerae bacterium]|nr:hypothetical protein [Phycisphaerae bacterium]
MFRKVHGLLAVLATTVLAVSLAGCTLSAADIEDIIRTTSSELEGLIDKAATAVDEAVGEVQGVDPREAELWSGAEDEDLDFVLDEDATWIDNFDEDLDPENWDEIILVAFDNMTGYDILLEFLVDGEMQSVPVYVDDTLLLAYPCPDRMDLIAEYDFDPTTGELVDSLAYEDTYATNPEDFMCGDLFIVTIDEEGPSGWAEPIDLYDEDDYDAIDWESYDEGSL